MATGPTMLEQRINQLSCAAHAAQQQCRRAEAEGLFRDLIELQLRVWGPEHEATLDSQLNLALVVGRHAEAEAILREVLQVQQQSPCFGMEHEWTLRTVMVLGRSLLAQGRFKEAEPMLRKVHALDVRVLGPDDLETLNMQATLGACLVEDNQLEEAEVLLRGVLAGYQSVGDYPEQAMLKSGMIGSAMLDLAGCLSKAGKHAEAEPLLRAAVRHARHNLGEDNKITIQAMTWHASELTVMGKHSAAEVMYRLAAQGSRVKFGWEDVGSLVITRDYVECLVAQEKWAAAEALVRDTLIHLQQALGEGHCTVLEWMQELALLLHVQDHGSKRNEAEALVRSVMEHVAGGGNCGGQQNQKQDKPVLTG